MTTTRSATPAQASLYQQLRGHLAVLKLHDAAEHLPAVLDAAHAEGLSLTAALERLLQIEVDATEARRLVGRLRFASLPTPATLGGQGHRRGDVPRRVSVRDGVPARELLDESSQYSSSWTQTGAASNLGRFNLTVTRPTRGLHSASTDWPRLVCLQTPRRSPLTPTARSPTAAACRRCTPKSGAGRGPPGPHAARLLAWRTSATTCASRPSA